MNDVHRREHGGYLGVDGGLKASIASVDGLTIWLARANVTGSHSVSSGIETSAAGEKLENGDSRTRLPRPSHS